MQKMQEDAADEYLVSADVMRELQISRRTLERYVADGKLPAVKLGGFGDRRYKRSSVKALLRGESASALLTPSTTADAEVAS